MINLITRLSLVFGVFLVGTTGAWAFTLSNGTNSAQVNNLGEEYRLNSPIITYAFDESFLSFFGVSSSSFSGFLPGAGCIPASILLPAFRLSS